MSDLAVSRSSRLSTAEIAYIAICAALMAVCSWISIPAPAPLAPFTLQTFAVFLILLLLGGKRGLLAILTYILLGAIGAPVFAQFMGGVGVLFGTTGGYIIGFLFTALIVGLAVDKLGRSLPVLIGSMALGILVCYAFGTAWFMVVYARKTGPIGLGTALGWCVFPYLLPDAVKIALASVLTGRLYPILNREVKAA